MAITTRLIKSFSRLVFPTVFIVIAAVLSASVWLVHETAKPWQAGYLVTPDKYGRLSSRAAQVTDENWDNKDGTKARGWLLRGTPGAPAVILLHKYGADRSHLLNLGVKLNEATNFTILMPDMRGHGENPLVNYSSFGGCETNDASDAIEYLKSLRSEEGMELVGRDIGLYGVEMGALTALSVMAKNDSVRAVVLDSIPAHSDDLMANAIGQKFPFATMVTTRFGSVGAYPYYYEGCYSRENTCEMAAKIGTRQVLLLSGVDSPDFQNSTTKLTRCFPQTTVVKAKTDLSPSGYSIINASMEVSESYDQRVIDYLKQALSN